MPVFLPPVFDHAPKCALLTIGRQAQHLASVEPHSKPNQISSVFGIFRLCILFGSLAEIALPFLV